MTTVQKQQRQQRQQRRQRRQHQMNKGGFLKNLHLKWWVWIIIIVVGINIIGSALAPFLSALSDLGKAMQLAVGVPLQLLNFFNKHQWMYYVGFFTWVLYSMGAFGVAQTYLADKILRDKAEGKSTQSSLDDIQDIVDNKLKEVQNEDKTNQEKGDPPMSTNEIAQKSADLAREEVYENTNSYINNQIKDVKGNQQLYNELNNKIAEQREGLEKYDFDDKENKKAELDDLQKQLDAAK